MHLNIVIMIVTTDAPPTLTMSCARLHMSLYCFAADLLPPLLVMQWTAEMFPVLDGSHGFNPYGTVIMHKVCCVMRAVQVVKSSQHAMGRCWLRLTSAHGMLCVGMASRVFLVFSLHSLCYCRKRNLRSNEG